MNKISKIIKIANNIDSNNPKIADSIEKLVRLSQSNMLDMFVPQNVLEQGYQSAGGSNNNGSLGGYHAEMSVTPPTSSDSAQKAALSLMNTLSGGSLPPDDVIRNAAQSNNANPQEVMDLLSYMMQPYEMGVRNPADMQRFLGMKGNVNLQFATQNPSAAHKSWGITPQDIMQHEQAHAAGVTSSPEKYMQIANPGADYVDSRGIGGQVNSAQDYYQRLMANFMSGQDKGEYGPNEDIWKKIVQTKKPKF